MALYFLDLMGEKISDRGTFELRHSFFSRGEKEGRKEVEKCGV